MTSTFLRSDDEYIREVNVIRGYFDQLAFYMHKVTKQPMTVVRAWIKKEFAAGGRFEYKSPMATVTVRDKESGDRHETRVSMAKLFNVIEKNRLIVSPSFTCYLPPDVKRSLLSIFIDENIQKRAKVKKEMQAAQAAGDAILAANKKNGQNSLKQRNNAMSGAHSSPFTILYNKSTHSSLTSMCRSATSYGNANNEKLLAGSRHYWAPGIMVNNIISICTNTDMIAFQSCVDTYKLHIPSVKEVMDMLHYSADLYWINPNAWGEVRKLVKSLDGIERAAVMYIGDLYQVRQFNPDVVREFLDSLLVRVDRPPIDPKATEERLDGDTIALISLLRRDLVTGNLKKTAEEHPENYQKILGSCEHLYDAIDKYDLFIKEIMTSKNVPASIAKMPDVIRRVSLVSDTDSTMATAMRWAEWYCGSVTGSKADDVSDLMIYIATQNIAHMMARMSTNIGVEAKYRHRYAMKNEFKFSAFALTNKAKHYFSLITSQEGVIYKEEELEMKGVALRTSNIPPIIMNEFRAHVRDMLNDVMQGRAIKVMPILRRIAEIEQSIEDSVRAGRYDYLKTGNLKTKDGYSKPESSIYIYHDFWMSTFATKYGNPGNPSYSIVKIAVDLTTKTAINKWLNSMEDKALAMSIRRWCDAHPGRTFTQMVLPEVIVANNGIPKEILDIADYRKIKFNSVEPYYHVLESLGITYIDKNRSKLLSEYYGPKATSINDDVVEKELAA